jgi:hypothetical protein
MSNTIAAVNETSIEHGLLIRITVNGTTYRLANTYSPVTYNSEVYQALGHFLSMGEIQDDLRPTNNQLSLNLSGIPADVDGEPNYIALMLSQPIKGSRIQIYRAFFDPDTRELLEDGVQLRFSGYISNFSMSEGNQQFENEATNTITVNCSSVFGILERQVSGRRTNPTDFGIDTGMYRVPIIAGASFDFGKPYSGPPNSSGGNGSGGSMTNNIGYDASVYGAP